MAVPNSTNSSAEHLPEKNKFLISAVNGTAIYILAYYLVWGLYEIAKVEASRLFGLRGTWNPSRILYSLGDGEWWRMAVVTVYGIGPALSVLVGFGAFVWYWKRERARRGQLKLLLLWISLHAFNATFGALLADTFTQSGSWFVPDWLFKMGNIVNVFLALLAGLVQMGMGYFGAVAFLQAHDSRTVMRHANRQKMVVSTLVAPWALGSLFIMALKLPYLAVQETLHLAMMALLITPMALGCLNELFSETVRKPQATRMAWRLVLLAVLVAVAWRLALSPPVKFG